MCHSSEVCSLSEAFSHLHKAHVCVANQRGLAVHDAAGGTHHLAAKHLPDALVAHADAKGGDGGAQLLDDL